jgi:hypothetical protein
VCIAVLLVEASLRRTLRASRLTVALTCYARTVTPVTQQPAIAQQRFHPDYWG